MRDYDVLLGILAYQIRLVSAGSLAWFAQVVQASPDTRLLDFLLEKRAISEADRALLLKLADSIVRAHAGDAAAALETFGGPGATAEAFARTIQPSEEGWKTESDETVVAEHLPHGLPRQIAPETVGRYTRGSEYARGGIGRILLVHDEQIGRDVILKELLPHRAASTTDTTLSRIPTPDSPETPMRQSASMMLRFLREAKITGQLEHPSIVPVYELGLRADGQLYYTMKLVRGDTLAVAIERCTSIDERLWLLRSYLDVCQAMAYAHSKGVIHRDLKPSNIMVGEFGECVVLDWGLAQVQEDREAHDREMQKAASQLQLDAAESGRDSTRTEGVLGTPLYMSPEQARAEADGVSYPSDVFSLGVILYEILAGEVPHPWTNSLDTIRRVGTIPAPPVTRKAPNTPPELAAICDKALAFEADGRYANAGELADDMKRFLEGAVVKAYAYKTSDILRRLYKQHKPSILAGAAAATAILITGIVSYIQIYNAREDAVDARLLAEDQRAIAVEQRAEAEAQRANAEEERDRAAEAEVQTAKAKYVSDIRLADAYLRDRNYRSAESTLLASAPQYRAFEWNYLLAQCNLELATLGELGTGIYARISEDGSLILTLSGDQTATLWNARSNLALYTLELSEAPISGGAFSPDGSQVAIWTYDGRVHLFDTGSGTKTREWRAHDSNIPTADFSSDGALLATAGEDGLVRVWNAANADESTAIELGDAPPIMIRFANADKNLVAIRWGAAPEIIDIAQGAPSGRIPATGSRSWPSGAHVLVLDDDVLRIFSVETLEETGRLECGSDVTSAAYYPAHDRLITGSRRGTAVVWNPSTGERIQTINVAGPVHACHMNASADVVVIASVAGRIRLYDLASGAQLNDFGGHWEDLTTVELAPDDAYLLTGSHDGTARKWPLRDSLHSMPLARTRSGFYPAALSASADRALWADKNGRVQLRDLPDGSPVYTAAAPVSGRSPVAALSGDSGMVGLVLDGMLAVILTPENGNVLSVLRGHAGYITDLQFNAGATEVLTTSWDGGARLWNPRTGEQLGILEGHSDIIYRGVFAPDGATLMTVSKDGNAILWDRQTFAPRYTFAHDTPVNCGTISADGTLAATGSRDGLIHLWELQGGTKRHTLDATSLGASNLAFSRDGKRLVAYTGSNTPAVWDTESGLLLTKLAGGDGTRPTWHHFHTPTNTHYYVSEQGVLFQYVPLSSSDQPMRTREDLESALATYREERLDWPEPAGPTENGTIVDTYLTSAAVSGLVSALRDAYGEKQDTPPLEVPIHIQSLRLEEGDAVSTVAGLSTPNLFAPGNEGVLQDIESGGRSFDIDVLRDGAVSRYRIHSVETAATQRTIELTQARALALLNALGEVIEALASELSENHTLQQERYGTAPESGLWVPVPRDAAHRALLIEAGLAPNIRISTINGAPATTFDELPAMIDAGLHYLENNTAFTLQIEYDRGLFETVQLTIQGEG